MNNCLLPRLRYLTCGITVDAYTCSSRGSSCELKRASSGASSASILLRSQAASGAAPSPWVSGRPFCSADGASGMAGSSSVTSSITPCSCSVVRTTEEEAGPAPPDASMELVASSWRRVSSTPAESSVLATSGQPRTHVESSLMRLK